MSGPPNGFCTAIPLTLATAAASFRASSQDRFALHRVPGGVVVLVADGAGGMVGGAEAAEALLGVVRETIDAAALPFFESSTWVASLGHADRVVEGDPRAGETTAVVAAISTLGLVCGASCGDSGAWVVGSTGLDDWTVDQNRRRVGSGRARPEPFARRSLTGTLVVATDGLFNYAAADGIVGALSDPSLESAARKLIELVRLPTQGFADDVALVLAKLDGV